MVAGLQGSFLLKVTDWESRRDKNRTVLQPAYPKSSSWTSNPGLGPTQLTGELSSNEKLYLGYARG